MNYSKTSNTLSTTLQVRGPGRPFRGCSSHAEGQTSGARTKRILMWLSCKVAHVARCVRASSSYTGGIEKNTQGMTATSTEW